MSENKHKGHYIHNVTYTHRERLAGAFVLVAVLGLLGLVAVNVTATHVFEKKVLFHAYVNSGEGIDANTAVRVSGIEAGKVASLDLTEDNRVHVELFVYSRFHERIRSDAVATLNRLSVLGVGTIEISPGSPGAPVLADGATIDMRETLSADQLMETFAQLLYQLQTGPHETMVANLAEVIGNIREITLRIREGKGVAGRLLYDEEFNRSMADAMDELRILLAGAADRLEQLDPLLAKSGELMNELRSATSDVPALVAEVRASTGEARQVLTLVHAEMQRLPDFMVRADLLLRDADELIDTLESIWPVSSALDRPRGNALIEPQAVHD